MILCEKSIGVSFQSKFLGSFILSIKMEWNTFQNQIRSKTKKESAKCYKLADLPKHNLRRAWHRENIKTKNLEEKKYCRGKNVRRWFSWCNCVPKKKQSTATKKGSDNASGWDFAKVRGQRDRKWVEK